MIKSIIEFLLQPFAWLWRRHERDVLCNGIEEENPATDFNGIARAMKDQMDSNAMDAFTDGTSWTVSKSSKLEDASVNLEEMKRMLDEFEERRKDQIQMIVITVLAPPEKVLVCRYEGKRYALINKSDWLKAKISIVQHEPVPYETGFLPLVGIPVVEDDALAVKILLANLPAGEPKSRWN